MILAFIIYNDMTYDFYHRKMILFLKKYDFFECISIYN